MTRARLPWVSDPDDYHHADVAGLHAFAMGFPGEYQWRAATDDDSEEGEAATLDEAKTAAETAALPLIRALVADHEAALVALRAVLP